MQGISDPQTFELSEVVKKSSKTGVFKNQRLLMIKDGFLYYFSNVPSDYKPNETNVMSSFKEFPKCSIEIRSIQNIKLESAKSSTLIIIFHDKDMIDRQDIRKSLSSKNYNHPVKQDSNELIEWSFIFDTVMKCRLWYGSLLKLKQYFVKNADKFDKFAEYMANFDPQIRSSLPQFANRNSQTRVSTNSNKALSPPKSSSNLPLVENSKYKMEKQAGIFQIQESNEEYDDQVTPKNQTNKIQEEQKKANQKEEKKVQEVKIQQSSEKVTIEEVKNIENKKIEPKKEEPPKINMTQPKKQQQIQFFSQIIQQNAGKQEKKQIKNTPSKVQKTPPSFLQQQNLKKQQEQQKIKKQIEQQKIKKAIEQENIKKSIEQQNIKKSIEQENARKQLEQQQKMNSLRRQESAQLQRKIEEEAKKAEEQRRKAEEKALQYSKQLQYKQEMIKKMAEEIENNKKAKIMLENKIQQERQRRQQEQRLRVLLQRQKRQQQEYKRLNESVKFEPVKIQPVKVQPVKFQPMTPDRSSKEVIGREYSIKTEFEREFIEVIQNGFKSANNKPNRYSIKSDFSLNPIPNQRQTLNLFRNTISYISEVRIQNSGEVQQYDYFWEIGQLYKSSILKQRITKELQLAEFVKKASQKATSLITHYIDMNKPKESLKIDRNLFEIQIICDRGKLIRTQGSQRLIYPNQNHQRLKRYFKIYNQLNEIILGILKKKPNFPLRVPFVCLVQYKGYTALARIIPPLRQNTINSHHLRLVGTNIPLYNLSLNDFQAHGQIYTIIQPTLAFKPTKQDQTSIVRLPEKNTDFLGTNRKGNISICSKKLFEQAKEIQANSKQRLKIAQIISFCRQLKKYMKATTPYQDEKEFQFFQDFLKNPKTFMEQSEISDSKITGILIYYIEKILGIKLKQKWNTFEPQYISVPVKRIFSLNCLDVNHFAINFEKYLFEKKYQIAEKALSYFKQLQQDYSETLMKEVTLHIHQNQFQETLEKLQLSQELMSIHDPRRLKIIEMQAQCHEALGDIGKALSSLKLLLEQTQYMYGKNGKLVVDVYFLIADLLSRQKLIPQLIQVYRKILQQNPDYRQKVLIDFSTNLLNEENTDPHILLDFLQKEIPESIEQNHPQIQELLGQLYFKVRNKAKAIVYFTNALNNLISQDRKFNKIAQIFIRVIQCCNTLKEKKTAHRQIASKMSALNFSQSQDSKRVNTYICCIICQGLLEAERDGLIMFFQYHKGNTAFRLLDWSWTQNCLKKVSKGQQTTLEQKNILISSINTNSLSQTLILLNNPNFI